MLLFLNALSNIETIPAGFPLTKDELVTIDWWNVACQTCITVVNGIEHFLTPENNDDIQAFVAKACTYLPDWIAPLCNEIIDANFDKLCEYITQNWNGQQCCAAIKVCK